MKKLAVVAAAAPENRGFWITLRRAKSYTAQVKASGEIDAAYWRKLKAQKMH